jgi:glutamate/tyrosine decarboxylase-like PLP-dependent enzyme
VRLSEQLEALAAQYGNRFLLEPAPDNQLPEHGMRAVDAMRLIGEELVLDGIPMRNLATFVTTWHRRLRADRRRGRGTAPARRVPTRRGAQL